MSSTCEFTSPHRRIARGPEDARVASARVQLTSFVCVPALCVAVAAPTSMVQRLRLRRLRRV